MVVQVLNGDASGLGHTVKDFLGGVSDTLHTVPEVGEVLGTAARRVFPRPHHAHLGERQHLGHVVRWLGRRRLSHAVQHNETAERLI